MCGSQSLSSCCSDIACYLGSPASLYHEVLCMVDASYVPQVGLVDGPDLQQHKVVVLFL